MTDNKTIATRYARELGFDLVRVTSADEFTQDRAVALERIRSGLMAGLPWYTEDRVRKGTSPQGLLPQARSIICLGLNYFQATGPPPDNPSPQGKVARYARGKKLTNLRKK